MKTIKIYYKGELNEGIDNILKDAMGRMGYLCVGSGYYFPEKERDIEFEFTPLPESTI